MTTSVKCFRHFIVTLSLALIGFPVSTYADSSGKALSESDFVRIANRILSYKKLDEFDSGPVFHKITGDSFSITIRARKSSPPNNCSGYPIWSYDASGDALSLELGEGLVFVDSWDERFTKIFPSDKNIETGTLYFTSFVCNLKASSHYQASNAFGVTATVSRQKFVVIAISNQKQPTTDMVYPQTAWRDDVSGAEARHLSQSLMLRLTGTVGTWPNGENVFCGTEHMRPKLDFPYDTDTTVCVFKAKSLTYEVIDRSTGETLYKRDGNGSD